MTNYMQHVVTEKHRDGHFAANCEAPTAWIEIKHLLKVGAVWATAAYFLCFLSTALNSSARDTFMMFAHHTSVNELPQLGWENFFVGLILWNAMAFSGLWLFAFLFNRIKK